MTSEKTYKLAVRAADTPVHLSKSPEYLDQTKLRAFQSRGHRDREWSRKEHNLVVADTANGHHRLRYQSSGHSSDE